MKLFSGAVKLSMDYQPLALHMEVGPLLTIEVPPGLTLRGGVAQEARARDS